MSHIEINAGQDGRTVALVTEEEINLLVDKAVPENTKKSTLYAVSVFAV